VDVAYQDEVYRTPYEACSCEAFTINLYTMNKICPHIRAVRKWIRYEKSIQEKSKGIADPGQTGEAKIKGMPVV
jgi:hypothetical protein